MYKKSFLCIYDAYWKPILLPDNECQCPYLFLPHFFSTTSNRHLTCPFLWYFLPRTVTHLSLCFSISAPVTPPRLCSPPSSVSLSRRLGLSHSSVFPLMHTNTHTNRHRSTHTHVGGYAACIHSNRICKHSSISVHV